MKTLLWLYLTSQIGHLRLLSQKIAGKHGMYQPVCLPIQRETRAHSLDACPLRSGTAYSIQMEVKVKALNKQHWLTPQIKGLRQF